MAAKALKNLSYLNKFAQKLRDYRLNMYANFGEIGEAIQKLVKNFQEKKGNMGGKGGKLDSISDIKDFITEYPEFKKMSGTVSKHVALVTELSKEVTANDLCKVSELEQNIACGQERDNSISHLLEILKMENRGVLRTFFRLF